MKTINLMSRIACILLVLTSTLVNAENYRIQSGDELSHIAEKKISQSGLALNLEQVMLTIYQKNPWVFIEGDLNRLIPGKNIYIPDNVEDFLNLSKSEALQKLRDKNYLHDIYVAAKKTALPESSNAVETEPAIRSKNYDQIMQTLDNHQQSIDQLKNQNAQLASNLKLLERAFGRLVLVQGLLTDEVVKVKSSLFKNQPHATQPVVLENSSAHASSTALTDTAPALLPKVDGLYEKPKLDIAPNTAPIIHPPSSTTSIFVNQIMDKLSLGELTLPKGHNEPTIPPNSKRLDEHYGLTSVNIMFIVVAILLLGLVLWRIDFKRMRSKFTASANRKAA